MWLFNLLFYLLSQLSYVEVGISRSVSVSPLEFEITRVDCICVVTKIYIYIYCPKISYTNFSDQMVHANTADPDQTAHERLFHCFYEVIREIIRDFLPNNCLTSPVKQFTHFR